MRKKFDENFKAKVALEALQGDAKITEIASRYGVHPNKVGEWKKELLENASSLFVRKNNKEDKDWEKREGELLKLIGIKNVELEFQKKNLKKLGLL
jgi:transposase-like protein